MAVRKWFEFSFPHSRKMSETLEPALLAFAARRRGLRVLDVGAWFSPYEAMLAPYARQYVKLDIIPRKQLQVVGAGEALPFTEGSFDLVLCTQVLEHVRQPFEVVGEMRRVLKPGGKVFLTTHGIWMLHAAPHDYWRFVPDGFRQLFKGYAALDILPQGGSWLALMQLLNLWVKSWHKPAFVPGRLWYLFRAPFYVLPNLLSLLDRGDNTRLVQNYLVVAEK